MNKLNSNYTLLIAKLDEFTRKFYLNNLIRGVLFAIAGIIGLYLLFSIGEYLLFERFGSSEPIFRKTLFFSWIAATLLLLVTLVGFPLLRYFRLGKVISHEDAARIIGSHFGEVEDRLLNILQLRDQAEGLTDRSLIEASIDQKIEQLKPVPFSLAIDLGKNKRYVKYALPPLMVFLFMLFAAPNVLRESNERLINNGSYFEREAPFQFNVENEKLEVVQYDDFQLEVKIVGDVLPDEVYLESGEARFRMQQNSPASYSYTFNKVNEDKDFFLSAGGFRSQDHKLAVLAKPALLNFELRLDYPSYTGRKDENLKNIGDAVIPLGSQLQWTFNTESAEQLGLRFADSTYAAERNGQDQFTFSKSIYSDQTYRIGMSNSQVNNPDSISFRLGVIPDLHPTISVEQYEDSTNNKFLYFLGEVGDDYGLRNLNFVYKLQSLNKNGERILKEESSDKISLTRGSKREQFTWTWDLTQKDLQPGDLITYYFEIWDNDGVNGSKSTRSTTLVYEMPTLEEFEELTEEANEDIKEELEKALDEISEVQEEIEELREKLVQKKELDWEDKQNVEQLLEKQQNIQNDIEDVKQKFQENLSRQNEFKEVDERIAEKQELLNQMFEEVLTEEMQQLMREMEELLEELSKEQSLEELQDMELTDEQLENELDRMLELFKQLELEQKMEDIANELEELADQQEELAEETGDKNANEEDLQKEQEDINEAFEELQEEMEKMREMNEELENSNDLGDTEQQEKDIEESLEQSKQNLEQGKKNKAQDSQQQSAEQMEQMAQDMKSMMQQMQQEQAGEDLQAIRQLLDNLIKLSFDQEALIAELGATRTTNPRYVELVQEQFKIKEDAEMVEDSLLALAKRQFQISTYVTREITEINRNMETGLDNLGERKVKEAGVNQQYIMTGLNNLALMLDEVAQQMQQQMAQQMAGQQMCQKPGGSKPSKSGQQLPNMGDLQQQLNNQLQQLKDGQKPGQRNPLSSQQFAQMAAKQSAIRQALEKMAGEMTGEQENGELAKELKEIADQMEGTEEDLVNKIFDNETMERQQEILTRLLEAKEAEEQREIDPERKSNTAQEVARELPPSLEDYLRKRQAEIDLYKTVPANLKPYYKNLVEDYIKGISF